jgi:hypothetical protein
VKCVYKRQAPRERWVQGFPHPHVIDLFSGLFEGWRQPGNVVKNDGSWIYSTASTPEPELLTQSKVQKWARLLRLWRSQTLNPILSDLRFGSSVQF